MKEYRRIATPPPTEDIKKEEWFHGTPWEDAALSIMEDGIRYYGDVGNFKGELAALPGMTYFSKNLDIAFAYARGQIQENFTLEHDNENPRGYLFIIDGTQFEDVFIDEDNLSANYYTFMELPWFKELAKQLRIDKPHDDAMTSHAKFKELHKVLTPEQHSILLNNLGLTIAHRGVIKPEHCISFPHGYEDTGVVPWSKVREHRNDWRGVIGRFPYIFTMEY